VRVIVVLGYSVAGTDSLHPVCAARLALAAELSTDDDTVVLSGWSRVPGRQTEADLMAAAWSGAAREVVLDPVARSTAENAANAVDDVLRVGAERVIVVTSRWHASRAKAAFRWVLRRRGVRVEVVTPEERGTLRNRARELGLWPLLPWQLARTPGPRVSK
jgi:uncharacterized SAM-binding protein YcdF (DUF218 family)